MTGLLFSGPSINYPSINDHGQLAFLGQSTPLNAVFVTDMGRTRYAGSHARRRLRRKDDQAGISAAERPR